TPKVAQITSVFGGRRLFICGSASSSSRGFIAAAIVRGLSVCAMSDNVFAGGDASKWISATIERIRKSNIALIAIPQPLHRDRAASRRFESMLAELVAQALQSIQIDQLFLEGGATASAVCRRMRWDQFDPVGELSTGVVQLQPYPAGPQIIIKP